MKMQRANLRSEHRAALFPPFSKGGIGLFLLGLLPLAAAAELAPERQAELRYLVRQDCGSCHGMTLRGGLGPALTPQALEGKPEALLINSILLGRPGTAMPPWEGLLTREEVVWIVEQLQQGLSP